jgi:magnesium transporter
MSSAASATPAADASASMADKLAQQSSASEAMKSISASIASASAALSSESKIAAGNLALPSFMKDLGIALAVGSGVLIGASFVFKKKGLIASQKKYNTQAGESMQYLKSPLWWTGMTMMILGEILNLIAYAVTSAVLVTPLGALSVVISAILSSIFLKEKLTLFGKIGCFLCIVGSTVIALNGPEQHAAGEIKEFQKMFLSVGFLVWGGICIAASLGLIFFVAPRFGKKYMLVYISVCSLIGGLSVSTISGVGSAIVLSIQGVNQFKHWFLYFLIGFVIITLLTEIVYLNKALELFNTAMVTPTYYVLFTFATLVTSIILFQGLDASAVQIVTIVLGFLTICAGITLLQLSKIDPDDLVDKEGLGLDRGSTLLIRASRSQIAHEKGHASGIEDPGIDTVRGGLGVIGSIVRARSSRRLHASADEYQEMSDEHGARMHNDMHGLNTLNKRDLERYELHDRPMPNSPSAQPNRTLPAIHLQMPAKRDTAISFASGSEEPHGHHDRRSNTFDSQLSSRDITSPTHKGGILLSPNSSTQGNAGRSQFTGEPSNLEDIIEATSNSSKSRPSDSHRSSIRVVGPRPATMPRSESNHSSQQRDLRTMWDPSQMGPDDTLEVASSAMAVAPSPNQRNEDGRIDYLASVDNLDDTIDQGEEEEDRNISPAVRRKGGGSRNIFSASGMHKDGHHGGDNLGDDESEGLLTPQMRNVGKFESSSHQSNKRR